MTRSPGPGVSRCAARDQRAWRGAGVCIVLVIAAGAASAAEKEAQFVEGPIRTCQLNDGTMATRYLRGRGAEDLALWVADETEVVRGLLVHLHRGSEAYRRDFQDYARTQDFAVFAAMIRWADFEKVLPDQLAKLGKALGHPEAANVPWACLGGSRNVGALLNFYRLDPASDDRILCFLFNGGPGAGLRLNDPEEIERFAGVPILAVNGSADPFVDRMNWQHRVYPAIRKHNLPYGVAVDWGCGHAPQEGFQMWWPFIKAVYDARVPAGADPTRGRIELKPMTYEQGWLTGPVDWDDQWGPKAAPVKRWSGPTKGTVWLPDQTCVRVWRSFLSRETDAEVRIDDGELSLANVPDKGFEKVEYFADGEPIGSAGQAPFKLSAAKLRAGGWSVWARCATPGGQELLTQPTLVARGREVDYRQGWSDAREADSPLYVVRIDPGLKDTIRTLRARRRGEGTVWKLAFEDDFDDGIAPAWYNYYKPTPDSEVRRGHENDQHKSVDGTMQLSGELHAVAMLPYDWPRNVAVEYRARSVGERICDLSVVLSGNPSGSAFPWRAGMMYQCGAHWNQGSFFLVLEQPHRNWKPYDSGARIRPDHWHKVRVERLDGVAKAWVDGKLRNTREITEHDFASFYGQKIGLYTFSSTARFDDVRIFVRKPKDPETFEPAAPSRDALDALAAALVGRMADPFVQQRNAAWRLLRENSCELADSLKRLTEAGRVPEKARPRVRRVVAGKRPR